MWKIDITSLIKIKASLSKNFHIQPSEIDKMPMWEYELFIKELNKQVEEENKQQEKEMDKYHVNDIQKNMGKYTNPKMPNFNMPSLSTPRI